MYIGADLCPRDGPSGGADDASIDAYALAGPLFISVALTSAGLMLHLCGMGAEKIAETKDEFESTMSALEKQQQAAATIIKDLENSEHAAVKIGNFALAQSLRQAQDNAREAQALYKPNWKKAASLTRTSSGVPSPLQTICIPIHPFRWLNCAPWLRPDLFVTHSFPGAGRERSVTDLCFAA
jgi:hypothetical protein